MRVKYRPVFFAALLPTLFGCPQRSEVWVRTPATTEHLVFELGHRRGKPEPIELWTARVDREVPYDTTADGLLTYTDYPGRRLTCQFVCTKIGPSADPKTPTGALRAAHQF